LAALFVVELNIAGEHRFDLTQVTLVVSFEEGMIERTDDRQQLSLFWWGLLSSDRNGQKQNA
jgi:hypothetical protein